MRPQPKPMTESKSIEIKLMYAERSYTPRMKENVSKELKKKLNYSKKL